MAKVKGANGSAGSKGPSQKPDTVRVKLTLRRSTLHRLKVHALGLGDLPIGQVVDDLVAGQPVRFSLVDRAKGSGGSEVTPATPRHDGQDAPPGPPSLGLVREVG